MIITLAGQKGGSGKTTTAICIADELHERGRDVLVVDTDPQSTARTWADLKADLDIEGPTVIGMAADFHKRVDRLADGYSDVVIDCPPGHSEIQRSALMAADVAIVPCGPGTTDVWSIADTVDLARKARTLRPSLHVGILITRKDARTTIADRAKAALEATDLPLFEATLGFRVAYQECLGAGVGVTRYESTSTAADEIRELVDEIEQLAGTARLHEVGA